MKNKGDNDADGYDANDESNDYQDELPINWNQRYASRLVKFRVLLNAKIYVRE